MKRACFVLACFALASCDAVPNVTYVDDSQVTTDGGNTCPSEVPPYAMMCCGPIACTGSTCTAACNDCVAQCGLAELCCPNTQGHVSCKATLQCP